MSNAEAFDWSKADKEVAITECFKFIFWLNLRECFWEENKYLKIQPNISGVMEIWTSLKLENILIHTVKNKSINKSEAQGEPAAAVKGDDLTDT